MPRSVNAVASRARRKRILKQAKGFYGKRKRNLRQKGVIGSANRDFVLRLLRLKG